MTTVYTITNKITGRTYVGKTSRRFPPARIAKHFEALRSNRHKVEMMQDDFNKYGEDSFDELEGDRMEVFMMKVLRSQDRRFGYNYKDRSGTSKYAIADRWRTPPRYWGCVFRSCMRRTK